MRRISLLLIACLIFALSSCQGDAPESQNSGTPTASERVAETPVPEETSQTTDDANQTTQQPVEQASAGNGGVVEMNEKMFIAQLNDIYLNQDDYLGKTIKYEGMFTKYTWEETGMTYHLVYRNSPGCCGADGQAGFEVIWPEGSDKTYPNENDWCEVVGTLETYDENGQSYLRIRLDLLTIKEERGAEFVSQ